MMKRHIEFALSAFNDEGFSDRVLRVETISNSDDDNALHPKFDSEGSDFSNQPKLVRAFHVSSHILSVHSPFFYKLFRNGMRESTQTHVTLKINPSEEEALEEVLKFMYTHELSTDSVPCLVNVLVVVDRLEVASCVSYCSNLLQKKPLSSFEDALLYLDLPSRLSVLGNLLEPLKEVAIQYFVRVIRDFTKSEEEAMAMALPLCALEAVLGSDGLRVGSEDELYVFLLKWAREHYPERKERREILTKRLARFIYFPYLGIHYLEEIRAKPERFDTEAVLNLMLESLHLNAGFPYGQRQRMIRAEDDPSSSDGLYLIQRVYKFHPVKVVKLKPDGNSIAVYLCLTPNDWENLFQAKQRKTQAFVVGGKGFFLELCCTVRGHLDMQFYRRKDHGMFRIDYQFAVLTKGGFRTKLKADNCTFTGRTLRTPSMAVNAQYFIDDMLHLRAQLTLNPTLDT